MELIHNLLEAGQLRNSSQGVLNACSLLEGDLSSPELYEVQGHLLSVILSPSRVFCLVQNLCVCRLKQFMYQSCDPSADSCCRSDPLSPRGISPSYEMCSSMKTCTFESECKLIEDRCTIAFTQSAVDTGYATCPNTCTFLETKGPQTLPIVSSHILSSPGNPGNITV